VHYGLGNGGVGEMASLESTQKNFRRRGPLAEDPRGHFKARRYR